MMRVCSCVLGVILTVVSVAGDNKNSKLDEQDAFSKEPARALEKLPARNEKEAPARAVIQAPKWKNVTPNEDIKAGTSVPFPADI